MTELDVLKRHMWKLRENLSGKFAVLFSGGIDSGVVAYAARDFADAVTVTSEFTFRYKMDDAINFAAKHEIIHRVSKLEMCEEVKKNTFDRCYLCKKKIIWKIKILGYDNIFDGSNTDDLKENRPGIKAVKEENVISPLIELNFGKSEVMNAMREIDKDFALKPHESCIATRVPLNYKITPGRLKRIEEAEEYIRSLGFPLVRVRDYFPEARIEVEKDNLKLFLENRENIIRRLKSMGYDGVFLNLEPYKRIL